MPALSEPLLGLSGGVTTLHGGVVLCPQEFLSDRGGGVRKVAAPLNLGSSSLLEAAPVLQVGVRVGSVQNLVTLLFYSLGEGFTDFRISSLAQLPRAL